MGMNVQNFLNASLKRATPKLEEKVVLGILAGLHLDTVSQRSKKLDLKLVRARKRERHPRRSNLREVAVPHAQIVPDL